jgi:hypothetical protein
MAALSMTNNLPSDFLRLTSSIGTHSDPFLAVRFASSEVSTPSDIEALVESLVLLCKNDDPKLERFCDAVRPFIDVPDVKSFLLEYQKAWLVERPLSEVLNDLKPKIVPLLSESFSRLSPDRRSALYEAVKPHTFDYAVTFRKMLAKGTTRKDLGEFITTIPLWRSLLGAAAANQESIDYAQYTWTCHAELLRRDTPRTRLLNFVATSDETSSFRGFKLKAVFRALTWADDLFGMISELRSILPDLPDTHFVGALAFQMHDVSTRRLEIESWHNIAVVPWLEFLNDMLLSLDLPTEPPPLGWDGVWPTTAGTTRDKLELILGRS